MKISKFKQGSVSAAAVTAVLVVLAIIVGLGFLVFKNEASVISENPRHLIGADSAKVLVEEFSDFQCPACGTAAPIIKQLEKKYAGQIKLSYRQFPLTQIHPLALPAAVASECADKQGKFWEYHDLLFQNQPNFTPPELENYARTLTLNVDLFNQCRNNSAPVEALIRGDMELGNRQKVQATPTFFVNGVKIEGVDGVEAAIQAALK